MSVERKQHEHPKSYDELLTTKIREKNPPECCPICSQIKSKYALTRCCGKWICNGCFFKQIILKYYLTKYKGRFSCPLPKCSVIQQANNSTSSEIIKRRSDNYVDSTTQSEI
ncbi:hypothetical protein GJ496_007130 [Pomphorhynchus laevis]|nr:hypothetical protein GJ496_011145 [Pomphorhynchus laevis]KAI0989683.1 hypothetical protein GJ496_007130 [Pomphorhynchus laevis]